MNKDDAEKLLNDLTTAIKAAEYARAVSPLGVEAKITERVYKAERKVLEALCRRHQE